MNTIFFYLGEQYTLDDPPTKEKAEKVYEEVVHEEPVKEESIKSETESTNVI